MSTQACVNRLESMPALFDPRTYGVSVVASPRDGRAWRSTHRAVTFHERRGFLTGHTHFDVSSITFLVSERPGAPDEYSGAQCKKVFTFVLFNMRNMHVVYMAEL